MAAMRVCVLQPYYSFDYADAKDCYDKMVAMLDECDDSLDLIVMPEYCDIPSLPSASMPLEERIAPFNADILARAKAAAKRCHAMVFVNAMDRHEKGWRNATHAIDREGNEVGCYYKAHLAPGEMKNPGIDRSYNFEPAAPTVIEMEGLRFGFMTCYDFYFYESYAPLARQNIDVVIGCSHQRTDTHQGLSIINQFLSYHTNAHLIRSSVSLGEDSKIGGGSCVITPDGTVLVDMKSRIGKAICEIDPAKKYYKKAGFFGNVKAHYEYIEDGRHPWLYRNGGAAIVPFEANMTYPRLCAHRGFNAVAPENSMPAFGAAIALGAKEIEFDLWVTTDGEIVSCHDSSLDRVSTGTGKIYDHSYAQLCELDFGVKFGEKFKGLRIVRFEEILQKYAGHAIMNIHIKNRSTQKDGYDVDAMRRIVALIRKYDCVRHVYFMSGVDPILKQFRDYAPDIAICVGGGEHKWEIVDRAIEMGARKVQLVKGYFNQEMVDKAHANGIRCNVFWSDDPEEARELLDMGIDTILTNDYLTISNALGIQ